MGMDPQIFHKIVYFRESYNICTAMTASDITHTMCNNVTDTKHDLLVPTLMRILYFNFSGDGSSVSSAPIGSAHSMSVNIKKGFSSSRQWNNSNANHFRSFLPRWYLYAFRELIKTWHIYRAESRWMIPDTKQMADPHLREFRGSISP